MKIGNFNMSVPRVHLHWKTGMIASRAESRLVLWILLPVFLVLLVAAFVGLPLFQDGSSYLVEMLITHSAVRHERVSVLLFQFPTIFLIKVFHQLGIEPLFSLPIVRLAFNLNYALTPIISLLLSWLVVRKKREELFIWAALIILFVNLVNFSWVSELLISVQMACPLLLALLQNPSSKTFRILLIFLAPFFFFLHPLVIAIYLVLAAAAAFVAYGQPIHRKAAIWSMILFVLAALARGIYSLQSIDLYEASFAVSGDIRDYFVISRLENIIFLGTAVEIAIFVFLLPSIFHSKLWLAKALPLLIFLQSYALFLFAAIFFYHGDLLPLIVMGVLGIAAYVYAWRSYRSAPLGRIRLSYLAFSVLAAAASSLLLAQYASPERMFTLKMGLDLFVALLIMLVAAMDSGRELIPLEHTLRTRLVLALSTIFVCAIIVKSTMWHTSTYQLEQTLRQTQAACVEVNSIDFQWLQDSPYTMINNWSLPSLALVLQDERPRKALLAQNDCEIFYQSGMIQVDPWSLFSKEFLVPPLD